MQSAKRGRPLSFPTSAVQRVLVEWKDQVIHDGNIAGKKNKVWREIADLINASLETSKPLSAAYLYVAVKQNRGKLIYELALAKNKAASKNHKKNESYLQESQKDAKFNDIEVSGPKLQDDKPTLPMEFNLDGIRTKHVKDEVCGNRGNGRDTSNTNTTIEIPEEPDEHSVSSPNNNPDEPPAKKSFKRGKTLTPADQVLVSVGERLAEMKKEDNCDIFAKNVAVKLRSLTKEQRLCAEKLINETLFEAEMGVLTRNSTINTPSFSSPYYDQPMYNYPQPMQPLSSGMEPVSRPASSRSSNLEYEYQGYDCQTGSAKQFTPISSTSPAGFQTPPTHHGHSQNQ